MSEDENVFAALEKRASAWGIPLQVRTLDANEYRAAIAVGDAVIVYAPFDGGNLYQSGPMTTKKALKFGNSLITWTVDEGFKHNLGKPLASNVERVFREVFDRLTFRHNVEYHCTYAGHWALDANGKPYQTPPQQRPDPIKEAILKAADEPGEGWKMMNITINDEAKRPSVFHAWVTADWSFPSQPGLSEAEAEQAMADAKEQVAKAKAEAEKGFASMEKERLSAAKSRLAILEAEHARRRDNGLDLAKSVFAFALNDYSGLTHKALEKAQMEGVAIREVREYVTQRLKEIAEKAKAEAQDADAKEWREAFDEWKAERDEFPIGEKLMEISDKIDQLDSVRVNDGVNVLRMLNKIEVNLSALAQKTVILQKDIDQTHDLLVRHLHENTVGTDTWRR